MKILFVFGGLPHYYNNILNKLNKEQGIEISVLIPASTKKSEAIGKGVFQTAKGIEFQLFELPEYNTILGKPFFKGYQNLLNEHKPDAIVIGWPYILQYVYNPFLRRATKKLNIKIICKDIPFQTPKYNEAKKFYWNFEEPNEELTPSLKNKWLNRWKYYILTQTRKKYYTLADAHVNYIEEAVEIVSSYGAKKESIFITYNSPNTEELLAAKEKIKTKPPLLNKNEFRIIHVGRLVKWKRVDLLINAVNALKNKYPEIELVIVGTGPENENLITLAEKLGISNQVKFVGGIYDAETLGQYLSESSIYVLAGMGGLSINEAMCFEKPIICSVCDGTEKKLVRDGYNGFFFKNGNENDLIEKIDALLANPELMKKMGENSKTIIEHEINTNTVIKGYLNAFNYVKKTTIVR